jgi:hypothetical protein
MAFLDPAALQVDSFATAAATEPLPAGGDLPTTMRTYERDCTMPGLCPETW